MNEATDEDIAVVRPLGYMCIGCDPKTPPHTHGTACIFAMEPKLLAIIDADREKIAALESRIKRMAEDAGCLEELNIVDARVDTLKSENAKMRKALEQISLGAHAGFWSRVRDLAREALK